MPRPLGYKLRDVKKLEARRVRAVARLKRGESTSAVARSLGVGIQSVQRWARCYRLHGKEGLRRLPKSGPRPKLAREKLARLPGLLTKGPFAFGFDTPVWTSERIASLIWSRFRVRYSGRSCEAAAARLGLAMARTHMVTLKTKVSSYLNVCRPPISISLWLVSKSIWKSEPELS
jgi:transposase